MDSQIGLGDDQSDSEKPNNEEWDPCVILWGGLIEEMWGCSLRVERHSTVVCINTTASTTVS